MTKEKAKKYFDMYPRENVFHFTADGQAFTEKNIGYAKSHANSLKDHSLKTFKRSETEDEEGEGLMIAGDVVIPEGLPTDKWKNAEIEAYLTQEGIEFKAGDTKKELLALLPEPKQEN